MNEPAFYLNVIHNFVENGEEPDLSLLAQPDAVVEYLAHAMHDTDVKALVLNDAIAAQVFTDTMLQFVRLNQEKAAYQGTGDSAAQGWPGKDHRLLFRKDRQDL